MLGQWLWPAGDGRGRDGCRTVLFLGSSRDGAGAQMMLKCLLGSSLPKNKINTETNVLAQSQ